MKMWRERNPLLRKSVSAETLNQRRRIIEKKLDENEVNTIIHNLNDEESYST